MRISAFLAAILFYASAGVSLASAQSGPIHFYADLLPEEQSAPVYSDAKGRADFTLERETMRLSWKITHSGLQQITSVRMYGPQRVGVNGEMLYDLAPKGSRSPIQGSVVMTEGELQYLMERHVYVSITTKKYPNGELRGQVERVPPPGFKRPD
jgi:hypothetical protein